MKHRMSLLLTVIASLCSLSWSADHHKPDADRGRVYMRSVCKTCHTRGAVGGEITPLNKTAEQWRAYFATGKHEHGKHPLTDILPEEKLRDLAKYLTLHAADSLQPETCGR